jgi:rubrerythrin
MTTPTAPKPTVEEILRSALKKEEGARDFYAKLAANCPVDFVRDLLKKLAAEEEKHVRLIMDMQIRMRSGRNAA